MDLSGKRSSAWLGSEIDEASRDEARTLTARIVVAACCSVLLVATIDVFVGAVWMGLYLAAELYSWISTRAQVRGRAGTPTQRINFLVAQVWATAVWSGLAAIYWLSNRHGLNIVAILVLTGQLFHAQAFAFRSRAMLTITVGIPATTLVVLPLIFGDLSGGALAAVIFSIAVTFGYVAITVQANIKAARALRESHAEIQRFAYVDALTGLSNRRMFDDDFRRLTACWDRRETRFALLLVDLDGLKQVNDSLGHEAGDALLVETANTLQRLIRGSDSLARMGGDEFAVLMADVGDIEDVEAFCHRILEAFRPEAKYHDGAPGNTLCVGAAIYPTDGKDQQTIYKAADLALYAAKNGGGNRWRTFEPAMAA